ncbi:MAG TPA: DUF3054 domain-containing protein [Gaiellaceae bacterium]|nr:DUF3054 domain-containing protein [Gaiellaceae bacterium]
MRLFPRPPVAVACDALAIVVFTVVGLLSHDGGVSARGLARDALPLLGGWFGVALLARLYAGPTVGRLAVTWLVGITAGVAIRAAVLGHHHAGKEAAFLAVALAFTLLFVLAVRLSAALVSTRLR